MQYCLWEWSEHQTGHLFFVCLSAIIILTQCISTIEETEPAGEGKCCATPTYCIGRALWPFREILTNRTVMFNSVVGSCASIRNRLFLGQTETETKGWPVTLRVVSLGSRVGSHVNNAPAVALGLGLQRLPSDQTTPLKQQWHTTTPSLIFPQEKQPCLRSVTWPYWPRREWENSIDDYSNIRPKYLQMWR